jgi:hypothetical protein
MESRNATATATFFIAPNPYGRSGVETFTKETFNPYTWDSEVLKVLQPHDISEDHPLSKRPPFAPLAALVSHGSLFPVGFVY